MESALLDLQHSISHPNPTRIALRQGGETSGEAQPGQEGIYSRLPSCSRQGEHSGSRFIPLSLMSNGTRNCSTAAEVVDGIESIPVKTTSTFPFPLSPGCRSHLGASHQAKTHHKPTVGQDEYPGPQPASAMASGPGIILQKRGCCLSLACGASVSCTWGTPRSCVPAERDGAQQETARCHQLLLLPLLPPGT